MYQVYKSEIPDNIIRLFSNSNCCYDLRNSIKFEVLRINLEVGRNPFNIGELCSGTPFQTI